MLRKNTFLIFNNLIAELYRCRTYADLGKHFLPMLKMLIPYHYASIMRKEENTTPIRLIDPICVPGEFIEAELAYMRYADDDYTGWLSCCRESTLFRESDLMGEQQRLRSSIYQKCYQKFDVYDSLQYGIVFRNKPLGVLSIFRCREDGPFSDNELFLVRMVGTHLNQQMSFLLDHACCRTAPVECDLTAIAARYGLTARETQLLEMLTRFRENREIVDTLHVRESTLQKHYQNIFHKLGVTSRWEIMRLLLDGDLRS